MRKMRERFEACFSMFGQRTRCDASRVGVHTDIPQPLQLEHTSLFLSHDSLPFLSRSKANRLVNSVCGRRHNNVDSVTARIDNLNMRTEADITIYWGSYDRNQLRLEYLSGHWPYQ